MENLNAEEIKCGLEHCTAKSYKCEECPYFYKSEGLKSSMEILMTDALALINSQEQRIGELAEEAQTYKKHHDIMDVECSRLEKRNDELTEENERLRAEVSVKKKLLDKCVDIEDQVRADTVRKMQEALCEGRVSNDPVVIAVNVVAKEMLEGV